MLEYRLVSGMNILGHSFCKNNGLILIFLISIFPSYEGWCHCPFRRRR